MQSKHERKELFGATQGRILVLLCRRRGTVAELAAELAVTKNAVRAQLQRLVRDGLVALAGSRRGVRKPHVEYELTDKARQLFPRAYEPMLEGLADVLTARLSKRMSGKLIAEALRQSIDRHIDGLSGRRPRARLEEV